MTFQVPSLLEALAILLIFFLAGFAWALGHVVCGWLTRPRAAR